MAREEPGALMRRPDQLVFTVHVAGAPAQTPATADADAQWAQRCAVCGFLLIDNTAWMTGNVAVATTEPEAVVDGPGWYPAGALVGTDKTDPGRSGMTYVRPEGRPLDGNEQGCT